MYNTAPLLNLQLQIIDTVVPDVNIHVAIHLLHTLENAYSNWSDN